MTKQIVIDTDPGVDDAFTFLLALASPEIQLEALTTTQGNVTVDKATRNALSILELGHASHIPVAQGSLLPLVQPLRASPPSMVRAASATHDCLNPGSNRSRSTPWII